MQMARLSCDPLYAAQIQCQKLSKNHLIEDPLELLPENAVNDKVDWRVEGDQGVAKSVEGDDLEAKLLQDVDHQGQAVADEKDKDDNH